MNLPLFSADFETFLISPGIQAPPPVCLQFCVNSDPAEIVHARDPAAKRIFRNALDTSLVNYHNAAFDMCVALAAWPDLTDAIFNAFDQDRIVCTIAQQKLLDIASGRFKVLAQQRGAYALDGVSERLKTGFELDKSDPWRLKYGTLYQLPISEWPEDAVRYALQDARAQQAVYTAQLSHAAAKSVPLTDVFRQTRAAFWLRLLECRGIMVDPVRVEDYIAGVRETLDEDRKTCIEAGLVVWERTKWVKKKDPAMHHMVKVCRETEEHDLPITETGEKVLREELGLSKNQPLPLGATWDLWAKHQDYVKLDEDSCQLFGDELLESYQRYGTSTTQIARAERLRTAARAGIPIQASFQPLIDTGRTACRQGDAKPGKTLSAYGSQLQNPAKDKKVKRKDGSYFVRKGTREIFRPREGFYFCSTDYGSMELCGWAQVCIWSVGVSKLADVLNAGRDPHTELAATLARIPVEEAYARAKGQRGPELQKEFKDKFRQAAKVANFGFPGGMGFKKMVLAARKQYGVELTEQGSRELRDAWLATWPEASLYFQWANRQLEQKGHGEKRNRQVAIPQYRSGRVRGGCWYTHLCNTMFQGLCADIAKDACWRITREMYADRSSPLYGARLVNFLHDEPFSEVPIERAHEAAHRQAELQVQVGREWAPDVKWSCEPALMATAWFKSAEPRYDANNRLIPWDFPADVRSAA